MLSFNFVPILQQWPMLLYGLFLTILLTFFAATFGVLIGIACGWARIKGPLWVKICIGCYIELFRNTPFLVQLFFIFFGLPAIGVQLSALMASVLAIVLNLGAYSSEITRSGFEATPRGQIEAAESLALNRIQVFIHIILPPSLSRVWPSLVSQIIIIMLGSAICSQISVPELSHAANLIASRSFLNFEA